MSQRLIWNFELSSTQHLPLPCANTEEIKWEIRYFWDADKIINLNLIELNLMNISKYKQKEKADNYYLIPNSFYNIKLRNNTILYKPLLERRAHAYGFGPKIIAQEQEENLPFALATIHELAPVLVNKESFTYKFATTPHIKMELSRLEIKGSTYFSLCLEGKSLQLVELIDKYLLKDEQASDYVTFLQSVTS